VARRDNGVSSSCYYQSLPFQHGWYGHQDAKALLRAPSVLERAGLGADAACHPHCGGASSSPRRRPEPLMLFSLWPAFLAPAAFLRSLQSRLQLCWPLTSLGVCPRGAAGAWLGVCTSAWQSPQAASTLHLGMGTEQGMGMAPEPPILALQTEGGDQRIGLEIFSRIHILCLPLRQYRHLQCRWFSGERSTDSFKLREDMAEDATQPSGHSLHGLRGGGRGRKRSNLG